MNPALIALPILFACADRFIGGGLGWKTVGYDHGGPLRAGPAPYALAVLLPACWLIGGFPLLTAAFAWGVYRRAFGWKLAGASAMTPVGAGEIAIAFIRHSFAALLMALFWIFGAANHVGPLGSLQLVIAGFAFAAVATFLAAKYAKGDIRNSQLEPIRGAAFGALIALATVLTRAAEAG